ncbi:MAG: OmpA family protein [Pedobacter sp.]|uniref:OmpA family protein n=1 Tax=Pedobacter sp. TaxID=1411316 RepID=UPI002808A461|nr:OmpA family protein [Pedobacter sp.]MDQ8005608.1 OmpA family protein [Pedobacter sp.]
MKHLLTLLLLGLLTQAFAQKPYQLNGSELLISKSITFKNATSAELTKESEEALQIVKQYLDEKPYITLLRIEAHLSNTTNSAQKLTESRSLAVYQKLVAMGVDCKRLIAVAFGGTKPIADNSTAEGKLKNDRITFVNVALKNIVIGGLPIDGGGVATSKTCQ